MEIKTKHSIGDKAFILKRIEIYPIQIYEVLQVKITEMTINHNEETTVIMYGVQPKNKGKNSYSYQTVYEKDIYKTKKDAEKKIPKETKKALRQVLKIHTGFLKTAQKHIKTIKKELTK